MAKTLTAVNPKGLGLMANVTPLAQRDVTQRHVRDDNFSVKRRSAAKKGKKSVKPTTVSWKVRIKRGSKSESISQRMANLMEALRTSAGAHPAVWAPASWNPKATKRIARFGAHRSVRSRKIIPRRDNRKYDLRGSRGSEY